MGNKGAKEEETGEGTETKILMDYTGPEAVARKCTDVIFSILIIATWVCLTGVGIQAVKMGNIYYLTNAIDYKGRVCGIDAGVMGKYQLYYVRNDGTGVCVSECPQKTNTSVIFACVDKIDIPEAVQIAGDTSNDALVMEGFGYCQYAYQSYDVLSYCLYEDPQMKNAISNTVDSTFLAQLMGDVWKTKNYIFGFGFAVSLCLSFLYLVLIRIPGVMDIMVWGIIAAIFAAFIGLGAYGWQTATHWDYANTKSDQYILGMKVISIVLIILGVLWAALICFMRKRILLAEGVCKQGARCMFGMPIIILYPILQVTGFVLFMVPWVAYVLYTASMGTYKVIDTGTFQTKVYEFSKEQKYMFLFFIFCFYWTSEFIIALGQITVALCASTWYFTPHANKSDVGNSTVIKSAGKALWYHSGTAAFGSLVIAIVKTIRAVLAYLQAKAQKSGNKIAEAVLCCCQCCMWCLEKCLKFLSKNAYIMTAISSYSFCEAAKEAFTLIATNVARMASVGIVSEILLFVLKIFVSLGTVALSYILMDNVRVNGVSVAGELNSLALPCALIFIIAYCIAQIFVEIFGMIISTLMLCFVFDEEKLGGKYADNELKTFVDSHHDEKGEQLLH